MEALPGKSLSLSKKELAQVNEVLYKVLCHNICVVIQSMYEWASSLCSGVMRRRLHDGMAP